MSQTVFVAETQLPTRHGFFRLRGYKHTVDGKTFSEPSAMIVGDVRGLEQVPLRVHDACFTSEVLGSLKCDCAEQLAMALIGIQANPPGIVIYLQQEGRGIGLSSKIAAYALQEHGVDTVDANRLLGLPDDCREYSAVRNVLDELGVRSVRLMTNNPRKLCLLTALGVRVAARVPCLAPAGEFSKNYLETKRTRMAHLINAMLSNHATATSLAGGGSSSLLTMQPADAGLPCPPPIPMSATCARYGGATGMFSMSGVSSMSSLAASLTATAGQDLLAALQFPPLATATATTVAAQPFQATPFEASSLAAAMSGDCVSVCLTRTTSSAIDCDVSSFTSLPSDEDGDPWGRRAAKGPRIERERSTEPNDQGHEGCSQTIAIGLVSPSLTSGLAVSFGLGRGSILEATDMECEISRSTSRSEPSTTASGSASSSGDDETLEASLQGGSESSEIVLRGRAESGEPFSKSPGSGSGTSSDSSSKGKAPSPWPLPCLPCYA